MVQRAEDPEVYAPEDRELRSILGEARTVAVVGLSSSPERLTPGAVRRGGSRAGDCSPRGSVCGS